MKKKFRIAMIAACPFPAQRGTPVRIYRASEALAQNGHDVHVLTYHFGEPVSELPFRIHRIPSLPFYRRYAAGPTYTKLLLMDPLLAAKIHKVILKYGIDLIHAHHYEGLLASIPSSKFSGRPVIYDAHTLLENELPSYSMALPNSVKRMAGKYLDIRLPKLAERVITVTDEIRQHLIHKAGIDPFRITAIPNGVECERFSRHFHERITGDKTKRIIYTGNFASYQGIDLLLEAFRRICGEIDDVRLCLVSSFSFDAYEKMATRLGIRKRIEVIPTGFSEVPAWLGRADVAVNPRIVCDGLPRNCLITWQLANRWSRFQGPPGSSNTTEPAGSSKMGIWMPLHRAFCFCLETRKKLMNWVAMPSNMPWRNAHGKKWRKKWQQSTN